MHYLLVYANMAFLAMVSSLYLFHLSGLRKTLLTNISLSCDGSRCDSWVSKGGCKPYYIKIDQDDNGDKVERLEAFDVIQFENDGKGDDVGDEKRCEEEYI